jgi:membrane protein implicated in regulation of membrane protease activity
MIAPLQAGFLGPETLPLLLIVAGLVLSIAEAMAPGAHFIVVGGALLGAGLAGLVLGPLASPFALGLLVLVFGGLAFYGYHELSLGSEGSATPISSDSLKGQTGIVTERVTTSEGQVRLEKGGFNPYYAARSLDDEIPEGQEVLVIDPGGGNVVTVTSLDDDVDEIDRELARGRARMEQDRSAETDDATGGTGTDESADTSTDENADTVTDDDVDHEVERA